MYSKTPDYLKNLFFIFFLTLSIKISCQQQHAEIINFKTEISIENSILYYKETREILIKTRAGEELTKVIIPFTKKNRIKSLEARIEDPFGKILRRLDKKDYSDVSAISDYSLYEDDFVRKFELRHNEYPYKLIYAYEITFGEFISEEWSPVINPKYPVLNAELILTTDKDYKVNIYKRNIAEYNSDTIQNKIIRTWKSSYKILVKNEIFSPPIKEISPIIYIVPTDFYYGVKGNTENWQNFGDWQYNLNIGLNDLPETEKLNVDKIVNDVYDKREIVKKLYNYLQDNTRYINVSIKTGGVRPYPASYVAANRYGDCKALSNYMKTILEYKNIPSFYTIISGGENESKIIPEIACPQFNHIILTVPLDKDTLWLDCTSKNNSFGYVGTFIQNRQALMVDKNKSKLIDIPVLSSEAVLETSVTTINLLGDGSASINYFTKCGGNKYEILSYLKNDINFNYQQNIVKEFNKYFLPVKNSEIIDWNINIPYRDSAYATFTANVKASNFLKNVSEYKIFNFVSMDIPDFEPPGERKMPVKITYPVNKTDTTLVSPIEGYAFDDLPKNLNIDSKFGSYRINYLKENNNLKIIRHFKLNEQYITMQFYTEFYNFIKAAIKEENAKIILTKI